MNITDSVFEVLNSINVNEHIEKKTGLSYLSWAWAWAEVKKRFPEANYTIYENADGLFYHTDGRTAWVKTGVTICGLEHIEYLPVMDVRNKSIPLENITSFDVNKAVQRSLTKAVARHGLGLYVYAGEDVPESEQTPIERPNVSDDTLRAQVLSIAVKKGVSEDAVKGALYFGSKTWDSLNNDELRKLKKQLVERKDA